MVYYKLAFTVLTLIASGLIVYKIVTYLIEDFTKRRNFLVDGETMSLDITLDNKFVSGEAYHIDKQNIYFRCSHEEEEYIFLYVRSKDIYLQLQGPKVGQIRIL